MLPSTIDVAFAMQYGSMLYMTSRQRQSRFLPYVRRESVVGATARSFDRLGETTGEDITERHPATPRMEIPHSRRWVVPIFHHTASLIDDMDKAQTLINPQNEYAQAQSQYFGKWYDDKIIAGALGSAAAGNTVTTASVAFKDESVSINGDGTVTTLGTLAAVATVADISLGKILTMLRLFNDEDVDPDLVKHWACTPKDVEDLLNITEVGSADYNTVKTLVAGKVDTFGGFLWHMSTRLTKDAATETAYRNFAWVPDGIIFGQHESMFTRITEESTQSFAAQVYARTSGGAVRMEGAKVHECLNKIA